MSSILRPKVNLRYLHRLKRCITAVPAAGKYPSSNSSVYGIHVQSYPYRISSAEKGVASVAHNYQVNQEQDERIDYVTVESIDDALSKIDDYARRVGRVLKKDVYDLFDVVKTLGKASSIQSLYLIRCCGSLMHDETPSKKIELVDQIWNKIKELGIPLDISHYNALLKVYLENEHKFSPTDFLCDMEQNRIQPNRVTYQRMVERYCDDADINGATTILEYMKEKSIPVTESVFNSLIKGHARSKDFDGARNMLNVMRQSHLTPNADTYSILACGFAENGDIEGIVSTLDEAIGCGICFSTKNYLSIIDRLAVSGHGNHIDKIFGYIGNVDINKQDCTNTMLDLLNKGLVEEPYCILKKIVDSTEFRHGEVLFFRQMMDLGQPIKKIIELSNDIKNSGGSEYTCAIITRTALENGNIDYAIELFKEIQKQGLPLRPHYFWPIFARHIQNGNEKGIFETLKVMSDFGIPATFDTFLDYVFPGVSSNDPEVVLQKIKDTEQSYQSAVSPLFHHYCSTNDFKNALYLSKQYSPECNRRTLMPILISQYHQSTSDEVSLLEVLQYINDTNIRFPEEDFIGNFFIELSARRKLDTSILKQAHKMGISISRPSANALCKSIGRNEPEAIQIVRSMQYGVPLPHEVNENEDVLSMHPRNMGLADLEEHLGHLKAIGASTRGTLRHLLTLHCKNKDVENLLSVKSELDSQGFIYTPASYALMIDAFVYCNRLEHAEKLMSELMESFPDVKLDNVKAVNYATLLVRCNKFAEALDFLKDQCDEISFGGKDMLMRVIKKLLNVAADTGDVELTNNLYNFFMSKLDILSPKFLLEPLVIVHLNRNDIDEAIATYDRFLQTYRFSAARSQLFKKCIVMNDFERLQSVVDLTASYNGKTRTLHDLAFSFLECGHIQQAQKVLQTLGGRIEFMHMEDFANKLLRENKVTELEQFIKVTKDLPHVDKDKLYYNLLTLYAQNNDYQKAVDLWDCLQEENVQPSIKTLHLLANLLEKNDQPIPFVVPGGEISIPKEHNLTEPVEIPPDSSEPDPTQQLKKCLDSEDISGSIEVLTSMRKGHVRSLSSETLITLIDLLSRNDCLKDVSTNVQLMSYLLEKARLVFKPMLEKHSEAGDCEAIHRLAKFLPDFTLKSIGFNYFFNKTYLASGRHEELLKQLEDNVDGNVKLFSFAGYLGLLKAAPHLEERAVKLVETYASEYNFDIPLRALWVHYFTSERFDEAEAMFKKYIPVFTGMDMPASSVLRTIRDTQNDFLGRKFIDFLNKYEIKQVFRDRAYCCLLDIFVAQVKDDEAMELLQEMQTVQIPLKQVKRSTLVTLKDNLAKRSKPFPFEIPSSEDDSSSSSDSD